MKNKKPPPHVTILYTIKQFMSLRKNTYDIEIPPFKLLHKYFKIIFPLEICRVAVSCFKTLHFMFIRKTLPCPNF